MDNYNEILLLLMDFYNINSNYTDKDLEEFKKENSVLQDIDIDEIIHMLEEIGKYLENKDIEYESEYIEDEQVSRDRSLVLRRATIIDYIKDFRGLTFKEIIADIKGINYKRVISRKYRLIKRSVKRISPYIKDFLKHLKDKVIEIIKQKPDIDKIILAYKKTVQRDLDKARLDFEKSKGDKRIELSKDIDRLSQGDGIIPKLDFESNFKFGIKSMVYNIRLLIIFPLLNLGVYKYLLTKGELVEAIIVTVVFMVIQIGLNSWLAYSKIKKKVAGSLELRNFMWDEFPYGNGLRQAFSYIGKSNYSIGNDLDDFDFGDMDLDEMERLVVGEDRNRSPSFANEYEKALKGWNNEYFKGSEITPLPIEEKDKNEYITKFSFKIPLELELGKVEKKIPEYSRYCVKTILHDEISIKDSRITLFLEEKELPTVVKFDESKIDKSSDTRVYVGEAFDGSVYLDFNDEPHMLVAGTSNCGKGVTQNVIMMQLSQKGELIIIDLSTKGGGDYSYYGTKGYRIINELEEALNCINKIKEEAEIRMKIFKQHNRNKLSAYNKVVSNEEKIYRKYIVIDEFAQLQRFDSEDKSKAKELEDAIIGLGEQARAVGIHFIIATQSPKANVINTELRNNLMLRAIGKCADDESSRVCLDNDFASVGRIPQLINPEVSGRFIIRGAKTKDRLAFQGHFVVQVPHVEFAGDTADEHIAKYGYLVEEPKVSKIIERYKKGEVKENYIEQCIDTDKQIHNTLEEKTAEDYL